ncbi:hypothetical protein A33M_1677 [Rhodovulum sp. PH10]|nr:hypothetical protein A33M_1677 [Rhodovulum sp. PH10]
MCLPMCLLPVVLPIRRMNVARRAPPAHRKLGRRADRPDSDARAICEP